MTTYTRDQFVEAVTDLYGPLHSARLALIFDEDPHFSQPTQTRNEDSVLVAVPRNDEEFAAEFVDFNVVTKAIHRARHRPTVAHLRITAPYRLRELARELGYTPEILGQISGYWVGPGQEIPAAEPAYTPDGAILPSTEGAAALDLVLVNHRWVVLSTAAVAAYSHALGLEAGEPWAFVSFSNGARTIFDVRFAGHLAQGEIASHFSDEAAERARVEYPAVLLNCEIRV